MPAVNWTVDAFGKAFTAPAEIPDDTAYWLGFTEGQDRRSSSYSLAFDENSDGKLEISGEEVLRMPLNDPLAAELRQGAVTSGWSGWVQATSCAVFTPGSGLVFPGTPRITVGEEQVVARFPVPPTTLDLTDATSIQIQCSYESGAKYTPPLGAKDFTFTARGYSFTGISEVNPYVQEPHSIKFRTPDADIWFDLYLAPDGDGAGLATSQKPEPEDPLRNELALFIVAAVIGPLLAGSWLPHIPVEVVGTVTGISATAGFVLGVSDSSLLGAGTPAAFLTALSFAWWSLLLPALLIIAVAQRPEREDEPPSPRLPTYGAVVPFALVVLAVAAVIVRYAVPEDGPALATSCLGSALLVSLAFYVLGRDRWVDAALGVLLFAGLWLAPLLDAPLPAGLNFALVVGCSLPWAGALMFCVCGAGGRRAGALVLTGFTAALCLFPASKYLTLSGDDALFRAVADITPASVGYGLIQLAALAAAAACAVLVFRRGADAEAVRDDDIRLCGVLLVGLSISPLMAGVPFMASDVIACVLGMITFWFLLPDAKADFAYRLSRLSTGAYVRLMHAEARNRLHRQAWFGFHRSAAGSLSTEETGTRDFELKWRAFADRAVPVTGGSSRSTNPAIASSAARTPRQNGMETGLLGLVFAIPVVVIDLRSWESIYPGVSLSELAMLAMHILRWVIYAAFYGYFYPRLPGHVPVAKSTYFLAAVLLPELTLIPLTAPYSTRETLTVLLLRTGEIVVFCYGLGLSWEIRLARLAGLPWSGLRDLRRLSAVTAPAATVIVAAATTIATALAGAATVAMLQSGPAGSESPPVPPSGTSVASPAATP